MKTRSLNVCDTCRARKLGCDGIRPGCSQCTAKGKKCPGYQSAVVFQAPLKVGSYEATRRPERGISTGATTPDLGKPEVLHMERSNPKPPSPFIVERPAYMTKLSQEGPPDFIQTRTLCWPFLDVISLVVQNFVPVPNSHPPNTPIQTCKVASERVCGEWVYALPELARMSRAEEFLEPAVKAMALAIIAHGPEGKAPVSEALENHMRASANVRTGLSSGSCSEILMAAVMCLYLSESMLPTCLGHTHLHIQGIEAMMLLKGPEFFISGLAHRLFVGFRPILFNVSYYTSKISFAFQEPWTDIPFLCNPPSRLQALFTTVGALSSVPWEIQKIQEHFNPTSTGINMGNNARQLYRDLGTKIHYLDQLNNHPAAKVHDGQSLIDSMEYVLYILPETQHTDIGSANYYTHLWAFYIAYALRMQSLLRTWPSLAKDMDQAMRHLISDQVISRLACLIFRSTNFLLSEDFKIYGAASVILPLRIACELRTLQSYTCQDSTFGRCLEEAVSAIQQRGVISIEYFLRDLI